MTRDLYAEAEQRLGRELTPGERLVDVDRIDRLLEDAKKALAAEIEKEKRRAIRRWLNGERLMPNLNVTPGMLKVLAQLHVDGQAEAIREIRRHGFEPEVPTVEGPSFFAESPRRVQARIRASARRFLERVHAGMPRLLGGIQTRIQAKGADLFLGDVPLEEVAAEMERQVPGSLDVAGRLISSTLYAGMGSIYEENKDLFREGWTYTAMMDGATCDTCAEFDGTHYDSWDDAQEDLPDGGPNPDCDGDGRCRCRLVPEPAA